MPGELRMEKPVATAEALQAPHAQQRRPSSGIQVFKIVAHLPVADTHKHGCLLGTAGKLVILLKISRALHGGALAMKAAVSDEATLGQLVPTALARHAILIC